MADSIEELARAVTVARAKVEQADAEVERLEPAYEAARGSAWEAQRALGLAEALLEDARERHARALALAELRPDLALPTQVGTRESSYGAVWRLAAVSQDGVGLYEHKSRRRRLRGGTGYAVAEQHGDRYVDGSSPGTWPVLKDGDKVLLWSWQARWENRPKPPPGGGKWRWLKPKAQALLAAGEG